MPRIPPVDQERPLHWVGSSKADLLDFPLEVQREMGAGLAVAQYGRTSDDAKPWKGAGPGVFELVEDFRTDTYRAVYTVRLKRAVYVLHAFQKKSPKGVKTDQRDVEMIERRLRIAQVEDEESRH